MQGKFYVFCEKSRKRENEKSHTAKDSQGIDGGVGVVYLFSNIYKYGK